MLSSAVLALTASIVVGQAEKLPSNYEHLKAHDLLIGTWTLKDKWFEDTQGMKKGTPFSLRLTWKWILDKNAVEGDSLIEFEGGLKFSGKGLTGWDRAANRMIGGYIDSGGGYNVSVGTFDEQSKTWTHK